MKRVTGALLLGTFMWLAATLGGALMHARTAAARPLSAYECMQRLEASAKKWSPQIDTKPGCISDGVCGAFPETSTTFFSRLSPQCSALMEELRSPWSQAGLSNILSGRDTHACKYRRVSREGKQHPMLISSVETPPFVACTVPKAGCSNVRKLLLNIALRPNQPPRDALEHYSDAHHFNYPGLWHYRLPEDSGGSAADAGGALRALRAEQEAGGVLWQPNDESLATRGGDPGGQTAMILSNTLESAHRRAVYEGQKRHSVKVEAARQAPPQMLIPPDDSRPQRLPDGVPSFLFGRNPYTRLLSGFRDKMIYNRRRGDQVTRREMNRFLGRRERLSWAETAAGFQQFVRELWQRGLDGVNHHFKPMVEHCDQPANLRYDFYLRLEEMGEWFPCFMDGLGIRGLTERGWADSPSGRMYLGEDVDSAFVTFYAFQRRVKPVWNETAGTARPGRKGKEWDWLKGDLCWWAPDGVSCADYYASFTLPDGTVVPGRDAASREGDAGEDGGRQRDSHDTDSQSKWAEFYDQATADLVYIMYRADFETFGYERAMFS